MIHYNKSKETSSIFLLISLSMFFIFLSGFRPIGIDNDSMAYQILFKNFFEVGKVDFLLYEPTYWLFLYISQLFFNNSIRVVFVLYAICGVSINLYAIYKVSRYIWISIILYFGLYFVLHGMTQIRACVAAGIFLLSTNDLLNNNKRKYIFKIFLAMLFHYSSLAFFPLLLFTPKRSMKTLYYLLPVLGIIFSKVITFDTLSLVFGSYAKLAMYIAASSSGKATGYNIFNLYNLSLLVLYYFFLYNWDKLKTIQDILLLKIMGIMLFIYYSFSILPVLSVRVSEMYGIVVVILFAHGAYIFRQKLVSILLILYYSFIIFYQLVVRQGLIKLDFIF